MARQDKQSQNEQPQDKKSSEDEAAARHEGKFHYNPVGMSGRKAGIVEKITDAGNADACGDDRDDKSDK